MCRGERREEEGESDSPRLITASNVPSSVDSCLLVSRAAQGEAPLDFVLLKGINDASRSVVCEVGAGVDV